MKKLFFLFPVMIFAFIIMTGQKSQNIPEKWNITPEMTRIYQNGDYAPLPQNENVFFSIEPRREVTPIGVFTVSPNFRVHPSAGTQSEVPIVRHPSNQLIMLASANTYRGGSTFSTGVYVTTDGGTSWYGSDTLNNGGFSSGDPGPMIDKDGRFLMSYITTSFSMGASYSTNDGINWAPTVTFPGATTSADKNLSGTDDSPISPFYGRSYTVYTEFGGSFLNRIAMSYTTNGGVSWSSVTAVSPPPTAGHHHQGCDVRVGPNGEVYVVWGNCTTNGQNSTEDSLGFAKSTDGGVTWAVTRNNANNMNGIRSSNLFNSIRANGFPRIDVDRTGGSRSGWIYVVTGEKNVAPATDVADAILHRSTDGGTTWSSARINQDAPGNGKFQYFPAVRVDEAGGINVVYYDTRNTPTNDSAQVYVSRSLDGGNTWTDVLVSDHKFRPKPISGLAGGYQGDYIGITSGNSKAWPYWCEDITGAYQAWTASVQITTYPLNTFSLLTPNAGATITSFPNSSTPSTFTWDTSASTASYKWIFGNPTPTPRKITLPTTGNLLMITAGQLDVILAGLGVAQGDSLVGQWDVWAFENNQDNDSLKATNGPRAITLKRGIPQLLTFNLSSPPSGTTVQSTPNDYTPVNMTWTRSGQGVTYKWIYATPNFSSQANIKKIVQAQNNGYDSLAGIRTSALDSLAASLGVGNNDSIAGQWRAYAYSQNDSLASSQTFDIKIRRLPITIVTIGTGTSDESYPLNRFYNYYRWQGIYLGSEINTTGSIRKIKFYQNNSVGGVTSENVRIFFKLTTDQLLPTGAWDTVGATMVFSGNISSLAAPGWVDIQLSAPFTFNPAQNLMVYIGRDFQQYVSTYPRYAYTSTSANYRCRRGQSDTQYPTNLTQSFNRANVQFEISLGTGIEGNNVTSIPMQYDLAQNFPNPFNPTTKINFSIPKQGMVTLKVYDVLGKEIMTLVNEQKPIGNYEIEFNGNNLSSGVYFYKIEASEFVDIKRMVLIK